MLLDFSSKFSAIFDCNGLWLPLYYCELVIFSFWFVSVFYVCFLWCVWWNFFEIMFVFGFYQKKIDGHLDKHVVIYGIVWTFTFQQHPYCTCAAFQSIGKSFINKHTICDDMCIMCTLWCTHKPIGKFISRKLLTTFGLKFLWSNRTIEMQAIVQIVRVRQLYHVLISIFCISIIFWFDNKLWTKIDSQKYTISLDLHGPIRSHL